MPAEATREQFALLRTYLDSRHSGGGMSDMGLFDYVAMVEETPGQHPYRGISPPRRHLARAALSDVLRDGLSMVYSFFHPGEDARSLGTYMILDHVEAARARGLPYVYLGYWVRDSEKMDYKLRRFFPTPLEGARAAELARRLAFHWTCSRAKARRSSRLDILSHVHWTCSRAKARHSALLTRRRILACPLDMLAR